jgi:hypothetical protein
MLGRAFADDLDGSGFQRVKTFRFGFLIRFPGFATEQGL